MSAPDRTTTPLTLDQAVHRPDRPGTGEIPVELGDLTHHLVVGHLDAPGQGRPLTGDGNPRAAGEDQVVLGVVAEPPEAVTPAALAEELSAGVTTAAATQGEGEGFVPGWLTTSTSPRLAPAPDRPVLRRRNGTRVNPEWVIPPTDSRVPYYPNTYPLSCVGRLFVWNNAASPNWAWSGTASMVSARTILTASHCVPWGAASWKALFVPAYYDGASLYGAGASSWVTNSRGYRNHAQGDDMAVMRLSVPLGNSVGWFGYRTYNDDWEDRNLWTLPGYAGDKFNGNRPVLHSGFAIIDDDNDGAGVELEYKADTASGQSGAPVYGWFGSTPAVVGTHSGGEDNFGEPRQNVAAGGSALSNLIAWARTNWG